MAINKKLLHFATKANFSTQLANSNIDSRSIVFIKDTGEIWTHDKLYSCASWGTNQTNYVPLTIGGTSYNISKDGHTHSYLPLSGGTLSGSIILKGSTSADMTDTNIHPRLRFDNSDSSQTVSFIFTDYDTYRTPAGIKLIGNQGNEWFEAPKLIKTGSSDNYVLLGGGGHKAVSTFTPSLVTSTTSTGTTNVATTNTNTYLNIVQGGTSTGSSTRVIGTGSVTVSSDTSGKLTINGVDSYLPLSGGTLSGNLFIPNNTSVIQNQASTSNYTTAIKWYKGGVSQNIYDPQIGQYNKGGTGSGAITILPYSTNIDPWNGTVGLYLSETAIKFNSNTIWHSGNFANGTTAQYIRGDGSLATYSDTTYSTGTLAQLNAGTDTTGRLQTAKLLNDWLNPRLNGKLDKSGGTLTGSLRLYNNNWGSKDIDYTVLSLTPPTHTGGPWNHILKDDSSKAYYTLAYNLTKVFTVNSSGTTTILGTVTAPTFIGALSGNASSASKLTTTTAGSATRPVYFANGIPVAGTYTFGNASGNAAISNGTVCTNLNADLLDGYHIASIPLKSDLLGNGISVSGFSSVTGGPLYVADKYIGVSGYDGQPSVILVAPIKDAFTTKENWSGCIGRFTFERGSTTAGLIQGYADVGLAKAYFTTSGYVLSNLNCKVGYCVYNSQMYLAIHFFTAYSYFGISFSGRYSGNCVFNRVPYSSVTGWTDLGGRLTHNGVGLATIDSNVYSATKLQTARTIWGQSFNGTGNVSGALSGATTGSFSSTLSANRIVVTSTSNEKHLEFSRSDYNYIASKGHIGFITGGIATGSANQQVWIHSNGNTKIGAGSSSVPAYTLDVNGTLRATGAVSFNSSLGVTGTTVSKHFYTGYNWGSRTNGFHCGVDGASGGISFYDGSTTVSASIFREKTTSNLYIGARGGTTSAGITIDSSGKVGIGTISPAYKLDVSGTGRFTGNVTAPTFVGALSGNASSATYASAVKLTADNATNATRYPLFVSAATGNLFPRTDTGFTYNPSTGALTATSFIGALTGNASSATLASTLTIKSSASASWFDILWNSGTTVYGSTGSKLRVQPSTGSITSSGTITASGNITTSSGFINTGYPADAVLLAGGGATTLSGLYKHCCTFSKGAGPYIVKTGLFTSCTATFNYYNGQTIPYGRDFQAAVEIKLVFSVPASLPDLNLFAITTGTYKIDVTSYRTIQNGFEDRAWCIHSIGTNSVTIILAGATNLDSNESVIINVTKRM